MIKRLMYNLTCYQMELGYLIQYTDYLEVFNSVIGMLQ